MLTYTFTEADSQRAYEEWGANCGPNALAFALQVPLESVRGAIPDFEAKRYTNPTMMKAALANLDRTFSPYGFPRLVAGMFTTVPSLTRIQWCGPWTTEGANPKWAYRQTHWIATWRESQESPPMVFDVNGGISEFYSWKDEIVPELTASVPRANGDWFPTHVWRVMPKPLTEAT